MLRVRGGRSWLLLVVLSVLMPCVVIRFDIHVGFPKAAILCNDAPSPAFTRKRTQVNEKLLLAASRLDANHRFKSIFTRRIRFSLASGAWQWLLRAPCVPHHTSMRRLLRIPGRAYSWRTRSCR